MCSNRSMGLERALKRVEVNNRLLISRKQHFNILLKNRKVQYAKKRLKESYVYNTKF